MLFKKITFLVVFSVLVGIFFPSSVWAEESMVLSVNNMSEFKLGQQPTISGVVKDNQGNLLSDAEIQANFSSRIMTTLTDNSGQFSLVSPSPATEEGEFQVTIYVTKDNLSLKTQITYQVKDIQNKLIVDLDKETSKEKSYDNSKYDLFSRTILDKIEQQRTENSNKEILSKEQHQISEQRLEIKDNLSYEIKSLEEENESNSPRNAFLRFLVHIDHSVKDIFWNQFLFTEENTENARLAKENALQIGKSSLEATKIFQKEAAISQHEITQYNNYLNVKYGNATSTIQNQFNDNGKFSRNE